MDREQFIKVMNTAKLYDLTQGCSIFTPPWPGEKALEIHFFQRFQNHLTPLSECVELHSV